MHIFTDAAALTANVRRRFCEEFYEGVSPPPFLPPQVVKDTVNIQIGDVNDNAPIFHGQPYTVHIAEVRMMGMLLANLFHLNIGLHHLIKVKFFL